MSEQTYVEQLLHTTFQAELTMEDHHGEGLRFIPFPTNNQQTTYDVSKDVIRVTARIPKLADVVHNGGDFQLVNTKDYLRIYEICTGVLDSWLDVVRSGKYRGPLDVERLDKLDSLSAYIYPMVARLRPVATAPEPKYEGMAAFDGLLTRTVPEPTTHRTAPTKSGYKPRLAPIVEAAINKGLIKA